MSNRGKIPEGTWVEIHATFKDSVWHVDLVLNGDDVGGGTTPDGFLSLADECLYGDKNDWLNDDYGPLGNLERRGL